MLAIQIPGPVKDLPQDVLQIVENRNVDYYRTPAAEDGLAVAVVNAKDIVEPEDLDDRSATRWTKMPEVSIEELRQAFLDPGSRIRLKPKEGEREPEEHAELVTVAWEDGFLDGITFNFNPNLNVLVGGRGTGKSTVIESIRSVLGLAAFGDEARKAHEGIVRHALKSGTKISPLVRVHRPALHEYRIERTIPNPPLVRDDQGGVSNLSPEDVLLRVEIYGQHEISELTKSWEKLTRVRTAVQQLSNIYWIWKDTNDIQKALEKVYDVESVTSLFFKEYKRLFDVKWRKSRDLDRVSKRGSQKAFRPNSL